MAYSDFSDHVVHFTKLKVGAPDSDYNNFMSICSNCRLEARSAFGIARKKAPAAVPQTTVCFSEVPLHCLDRLVQRRHTHYGIGFSKKFARDKGGLPIWYVEKDSAQHTALDELIGRASALPAADRDREPIWKLTPFIDVPGDYPNRPYRFEWEREWRINSNFTFEPNDVAFLLIPETHHADARAFFLTAQQDNTGPSFDCPFISPSWDEAKIKAALAAATTP